MKLKASKNTERNDRRDNTIQILKEKINTLQLQKQKEKHENYTYLAQIHKEKACKPYFGLEKKMRMSTDRIITELQCENTKKIYHKSKEIVKHAAKPYYESLYDIKTTDSNSQKIALESINKIIPKHLRKKLSEKNCQNL